MLLPKAPAQNDSGEPTAAQELADPRYELVQKLLEFKRFKDAANALSGDVLAKLLEHPSRMSDAMRA